MAYVQSTVTEDRVGRDHSYTYTETGGTTTGEATVANVPKYGRLMSVKATLTAGSGSTIAPEIGNAATWTDSTQGEIASGPTAAAHVHVTQVVRYYSSTGILYVRSTPDSGADNAISVEILIREGWED